MRVEHAPKALRNGRAVSAHTGSPTDVINRPVPSAQTEYFPLITGLIGHLMTTLEVRGR